MYILAISFFILVLVGCSLGNTPTSKVEELLGKYQKNDEEIKLEIDEMLENENMTEKQMSRYKELILKQYQGLSYDVKEEEINGDLATVKVQIEVLDYRSAVSRVEDEYAGRTNYDDDEYTNKKLDYLEDVSDKVQYTIEFTCTKDSSGEWQLNNLTNVDIQKIQGMY